MWLYKKKNSELMTNHRILLTLENSKILIAEIFKNKNKSVSNNLTAQNDIYHRCISIHNIYMRMRVHKLS